MEKKQEKYSIALLDQDYTIEKTDLLNKIISNPTISKSCKDSVVAAKYFPKIKNRKGELMEFKGDKKEAIKVELVQHINNAINDSGYVLGTWKEAEINALIIRVRDDVLNNFFFLTTQEVGLAFYRGVREEYGEVIGLSARIFYKWLRSYCATSKIEANKAIIKIEANKIIETSEEEKKARQKRWLENLFDLFDHFKKTNEYTIYDFNNMLYDLLKKKGLIEFSEKERKKILNDAEKKIRVNHNPVKAKNVHQRNDFLKIIQSLSSKKKDKSIKAKINSQAKEIGLEIYIRKLVNSNKSLREIMKELV